MSSPLKLLHLVAAAAMLSSLALVSPATAQTAPIVIPPGLDIDPEDFFPPAPVPREEIESSKAERGSGKSYGQTRRLDAHDRMEEEALRRAGKTQPAGGSGSNDGKLICIAGCGT